MKIRLLPVPQVPLTVDGNINFANVSGVILRNAGTATVNLWNGLYTLDSKETLAVNVTEDNADMDLKNIPVTFDTGTGVVQMLQIILLKSNEC